MVRLKVLACYVDVNTPLQQTLARVLRSMRQRARTGWILSLPYLHLLMTLVSDCFLEAFSCIANTSS